MIFKQKVILQLSAVLFVLNGTSATVSASDLKKEPLVIQIESVVMGTDGQMRVKVNGQFLTRHSERDGIRVLDMDYHQVKVLAQGQTLLLAPNQTLILD